MSIELTTTDVQALEAASSAIKVAGERYPATHAKLTRPLTQTIPEGETTMNITFAGKVALVTGAAVGARPCDGSGLRRSRSFRSAGGLE